MKRREFITALGGAAAWPLAARAQQPDRVRRIGVLMGVTADDPEVQARLAAFLQGLRNWAGPTAATCGSTIAGAGAMPTAFGDTRRNCSRLAPDVIFASGGTVEELLRATSTVPIVFAIVPDPVGSGFVDSLSRPGRNATGFMQFEYGLSAKWLDLLKQIAPGVTRVAVLRDSATTAGIGQFAVIQYVASSVGVEVSPINVRDATEIERGVEAFARSSNGGGLIVTAGGLAAFHRELITTLAAKYKLPAVYNNRTFVTAGGLISYGADLVDQYRRAAGYVDRILKGEKPADLPVQAPTKYELAINLKTAKALGLDDAAVAARPRRRGDRMKRREFITLLGGAAAWPLAARAQQPCDAGDRTSAPYIARSVRGESARISPGPQGDRIRRRRERCVRISLG